MCGIGGFYNCTGGRTPVKALKSLWRGLEGRGTHAAGFALQWVGADKPVVLKQAGPGHRMHKRLSKFIGTGETTQYVMLHTRFTTQGSTSNNANNHPVVSQGMIVTHNGVLYNDSDVLARLGVTPVAEVDTEAINAGLARESPGWVLDEVYGSMSVAWVDSTKPDFVNLMTNGENPLVIARTESGDVVWSSTKSILDASKFKVKSFFHAQPFKVYTICPDGTIRSKVVSEQRGEPDFGWMRHAASHKPAWMRGMDAKTSGGRQNGRKAPRKATPVTVEVPGTISEDELDAVGLDGYDWDDYMVEAGYSRVWKRNQWVWVPASEVSQ
jgi:glutamine phosphoribosylpyrophosphate amidotransferase